MKNQKVMKVVKKLGEHVIIDNVDTASLWLVHEIKRPENMDKFTKKINKRK